MIQIDVNVEGARQAEKLFLRKARYFDRIFQVVGDEAIRAVKTGIRGEFSGQYYLSPSGRQAWPRTKDFGRRVGGRPGLGGVGGSVAGAVLSAPALKRPQSASISWKGQTAHTGGRGLQRNVKVTPIRAKNLGRMQATLAGRVGAFVSSRTLTGPGLQLPSRPYANPNNPETARSVEGVLLRGFERA